MADSQQQSERPIYAQRGDRRVKLCPRCGKEIKYWRYDECDECRAKPPVSTEPNVSVDQQQAAIRNDEANQKPPKRKDVRRTGRPHRKIGALPSKPSKYDEVDVAGLIDAVAEGVPIEIACRARNIHRDTFQDWLSTKEEFAQALAQAKEAKTIRAITAIKTSSKMDEIRGYMFWLERVHPDVFADRAKVALQLNQHIHGNGNGGLQFSEEELREARQRLDETKALQQQRRAEARDKTQESARPLQPIREVDVVRAPLAIKDHSRSEPESRPERPAPQDHSMRASDMDWSSGQCKRRSDNSGDSQESQAPPEPPHVRQRDRKQPVGRLSERQRMLTQQRRLGRDDGSGKGPW